MSEIKVNSIKGVGASAAAITVNNTDGTCTANITNNLSNRNKIINGSMICSQRGSSSSFSGSTSAYLLDRFKMLNAHDGASTVSQSSTSPDGFSNSLKVDVTTADASLAVSQFSQAGYRIEAQDLQDLGYGTSGAKTITVSFYVRSNKTGNYALAIQQSDNSYKQVTQTYTINSANTWERKTFSFAGDTSGVINNDNGVGLELYWWLAAGTTYTTGSSRPAWTAYTNPDAAAGQTVNLFDSTSNEWYITGVQFEVGSVATDFEHRSFGQELALCQRYYYRHVGGITGDGQDSVGVGVMYANNNLFTYIYFPTTMRVKPSLEVVTGTSYYLVYSNDSNDGFNTFSSMWNSNENMSVLNAYSNDGISGRTAGHSSMVIANHDDAKVSFSAEL